MKCNKIARQSFDFRESEKRIKEDSMEAFFSSNLYEIEKNKYSLL
jgi:hypothetical protein